MNKKLKTTIIILIVVGGLVCLGYNYIMHGGERNLESEEASFTVSSKNLTNEFLKNTDVSNKKYLEKAVQIEGKVTSVTANEIILDNSVFCVLKNTTSTVKENQTLKIKGRVVGFDDLMGEVKLDQCFIINN